MIRSKTRSSDRQFPSWSLILQSPTHLCIICLVLGCVLTLPFLGHLRLSQEEPRRAIIADNMLASGDYLTPVDMDSFYIAKPPLYNWLIVATSAWQGYVDEFSARLTSVIALLLLTCLLVYGMRSRLQKTGLSFLAFATLLSPQLLIKGTLAEIELVFTLAVTLSLWVWYWNYDRGNRGLSLWLLPSVIVGLSFLTKREPALVFYYFGVVGFLIYKRELGLLFKPAHIISVSVTLGIICCWVLLAIYNVGFDKFFESTQKEVFSRGLGHDWEPLIKHMLLYPIQVLFAAFPFSLLILPLLSRQFRDRVYRRYGDISVFALIAVLINLPLYWFRADAAVRYFMPMLPTALVLAALVFQILVEDADDDEKTQRWVMFYVWGSVSLCLVLAIAPIVALFVPELKALIGELVMPLWVVIFTSFLYLLLVVYSVTKIERNFHAHILTFFVLFILGFRLLYFDLLLPGRALKLDDERNLPVFSQAVKDQVPSDEFPLHSVGEMQHDVWFYLGRNTLIDLSKQDKEYPDGYFLILSYDIEQYLKDFDREWAVVHKVRYRNGELILGKVGDAISAEPSQIE